MAQVVRVQEVGTHRLFANQYQATGCLFLSNQLNDTRCCLHPGIVVRHTFLMNRRFVCLIDFARSSSISLPFPCVHAPVHGLHGFQGCKAEPTTQFCSIVDSFITLSMSHGTCVRMTARLRLSAFRGISRHFVTGCDQVLRGECAAHPAPSSQQLAVFHVKRFLWHRLPEPNPIFHSLPARNEAALSGAIDAIAT